MTTFSQAAVLGGHSIKVNDTILINPSRHVTIVGSDISINPDSGETDVIFVINFYDGERSGTERVHRKHLSDWLR